MFQNDLEKILIKKTKKNLCNWPDLLYYSVFNVGNTSNKYSRYKHIFQFLTLGLRPVTCIKILDALEGSA